MTNGEIEMKPGDLVRLKKDRISHYPTLMNTQCTIIMIKDIFVRVQFPTQDATVSLGDLELVQARFLEEEL